MCMAVSGRSGDTDRETDRRHVLREVRREGRQEGGGEWAVTDGGRLLII